MCDVCGKDGGSVRASNMGPVNLEYCDTCLSLNLEPYGIAVTYISCAGHFPDEVNEKFQARIRYMLPYWGKTEEEFIRDVDLAIDKGF